MNKIETAKTPVSTDGNVFFEAWATPDGVPPFDAIGPEQFRPAYARALAEHTAEVAAIAADPEPATFDNTIALMERSGRALDRVGNVFHLLASRRHTFPRAWLLSSGRSVVVRYHMRGWSAETGGHPRLYGVVGQSARVLERLFLRG